MIDEFDFQYVRLKPYYKVIKDRKRLFIMMAPCEVFEIPGDAICFDLLKKLENEKGLNVNEFQKMIKSGESDKINQLIKELWKRSFLISLDGSEFLNKQQMNRLREWLPFISRFTNKPFELAVRLKDLQIGIFTNNEVLGNKLKKAIGNIPLLGNISVFKEKSTLNWQEKVEAITFGVVASLGFYPAFFLKANHIALHSEKPMFPIILLPDGLSGIIGPFIKKGEGPCWNCFYRRYAGQGANPEIYELLTKISSVESNYQLTWSSSLLSQLIMPEIVYALTNIEIPRTLGRVLFVDFINFNIVDHPVLMLPRCEYCSNINLAEEKPPYSPYGF